MWNTAVHTLNSIFCPHVVMNKFFISRRYQSICHQSNEDPYTTQTQDSKVQNTTKCKAQGCKAKECKAQDSNCKALYLQKRHVTKAKDKWAFKETLFLAISAVYTCIIPLIIHLHQRQEVFNCYWMLVNMNYNRYRCKEEAAASAEEAAAGAAIASQKESMCQSGH